MSIYVNEDLMSSYTIWDLMSIIGRDLMSIYRVWYSGVFVWISARLSDLFALPLLCALPLVCTKLHCCAQHSRRCVQHSHCCVQHSIVACHFNVACQSNWCAQHSQCAEHAGIMNERGDESLFIFYFAIYLNVWDC